MGVFVDTGIFIGLRNADDEFHARSVELIAWRKFVALKDKAMSFIDSVTFAHVERNNIGTIMSFDSGFDGLIQRIH